MRGFLSQHRAPLLWILFPVMLGYAAARNHLIEVSFLQILLSLFLISVSLVISTSSRPLKKRLWGFSFFTALFLTAAGYFQFCNKYPNRWDQLPPREAVLTIELNRQFKPTSHATLIRALATIHEAPTHLSDLIDQRIFVTFTKPKDIASLSRSMHLQLKGILTKLTQPHSQQTFNRYLLNQGVHFTLTRGKVLSVKKEPSFLQRFYQVQFQNFSETLRIGLPLPNEHAAIYAAMLLGHKAELTKLQKTTFIQSGTLHLFAVSGLHIGVIALCLYSLLALLRIPPGIASIIGLSLLYLFVSIIGNPPSAERAFLMIALFWIAFQIHRPINPLASLSVSALIVLLLRPWQLFDVSFQFSYTVVFSIILYGIPLAQRWTAKWKPFSMLPLECWKWRHHIVQTVGKVMLETTAISLSAILISIPLSITYFEIFSPLALLINIALIPIASLVITSGILSITSGIIGLSFLTSLFNHSAHLLLWLMDFITSTAVTIPGSFWQVDYKISWIGTASLVILCSSILIGHLMRWKNSTTFYIPFLILGLTLIFGVTFHF